LLTAFSCTSPKTSLLDPAQVLATGLTHNATAMIIVTTVSLRAVSFAPKFESLEICGIRFPPDLSTDSSVTGGGV
jgi:hypothetical protein